MFTGTLPSLPSAPSPMLPSQPIRALDQIELAVFASLKNPKASLRPFPGCRRKPWGGGAARMLFSGPGNSWTRTTQGCGNEGLFPVLAIRMNGPAAGHEEDATKGARQVLRGRDKCELR